MPDYKDLLNVDDFWARREEFSSERWDVSFFCKDCNELAEIERPNPKWYVFKCKKCWWKNIAIWTNEWIKSHYKRKS